ncbi:hypothetical protein IEN52_04150 [Stenotrophomonas rhizophila]|nr:hypothetical protein [Stenotrophomonas rhizophila]
MKEKTISMRPIYWLGVLGLSLLPLNFLIVMAGKIWHGERMVEQDIIGFAVGMFGLIAATVLYRAQLAKRGVRGSDGGRSR